MKERDAILAILNAAHGRNEFGRTSLQKVAYLSSLAHGFDFRHRAHYFGPFSEVVEESVDTLVLAGLVEEKETYLGFTGSGGFQARQFEYELTKGGAERIEALKAKYSDEVREIDELVRQLIELGGGLEQNILSPAAKTLFIAKNQNRSLSSDEIAELARELGWNLTTGQVDRVADLLAKLDLVSTDAGGSPSRRSPELSGP